MKGWKLPYFSLVRVVSDVIFKTAMVLTSAIGWHKSSSQWRSQDIADARAQHGILRLYKLRKVQKLLGGLGYAPPENF